MAGCLTSSMIFACRAFFSAATSQLTAALTCFAMFNAVSRSTPTSSINQVFCCNTMSISTMSGLGT